MTDQSDTRAHATGASKDSSDNRMDPEQQAAPWINPEIQRQMKWRDGDIVVSVPLKSGTTWTMNIVHQLKSGGDPDLDDVYQEVPWIEFVTGPTVTLDELVRRIDSMPDHARRAFKTHAAPGTLPYQAPGSGIDVQYVVVVRNPDEVLASFYPFVKAHSAEWFALWGIDKQEFVPPDIRTCFETLGKAMLPAGLFGFLSAWWPLRHASNVLLLHFSDMKRDHEGSMRKIADFLGFEPTAEQWPAILEYTSFVWMKRHERKFEIRHAADAPVLDSGAMVRKGETGVAREDGVTPELSAQLEAIGKGILTDERAFEWLYSGGALP